MVRNYRTIKMETQILIRLDESIHLPGTVKSKHYQPLPPQLLCISVLLVQAQIDSTW